jgi:protein-arginine kinase
MDDNLDHVRVEWLRRLERREVAREEAESMLPVMKARLELLRNLHSRIADQAEFSGEARDVVQEIERQLDEIKVIEHYIEQPNGAE